MMVGGSAQLYTRNESGVLEILASPPSDGGDSLVAELTQVVAELKKYNDVPERVRPIQHLAFFPSKAVANEFAKHLIDDDYACITVKDWGDERWRVDFYNPGIATLPYLIACCRAVQRKVEGAGGDYDGWELPCMPAEILDAA
ncbi:hypothetical protein BL248_22680 [Ralstonia solanacearum]|nr:hypothetical protein BL248_22680 [Ralstonia solanacearum]